MKKRNLYPLLALIVILSIVLINGIINIYNENTKISLKNEEIEEIYSEYDKLITNTNNILNNLCYFEKNSSCSLKEKYKDNENYNYYNGLLLQIANRTKNITSPLKKKPTFITYSKLYPETDLYFKTSIVNTKNLMMVNLLNDNKDSIINDYLNTSIKLLDINYEETYHYKKKHTLFYFDGKNAIYDEYKKTLENELESTKILYNIVKHIEQELQ